MSRRSLACLAFLVLPSASLPLQAPQPSIAVEVPFPFHAGGRKLPAGTYEFNPDIKQEHVAVTDRKKGQSVLAPVLTRISQRPDSDIVVVFDQINTEYYLSEFYPHGMDGFHLTGAPGPHTHVCIKAKK
jgi:hypothetical protein